jgi:hypothetical protein
MNTFTTITVCQTQQVATATLAKLRQVGGKGTITMVVMDLSSFNSVRAGAAEVCTMTSIVNILYGLNIRTLRFHFELEM